MTIDQLPRTIRMYYRRMGRLAGIARVEGRKTPSGGESYTVQLASGLRQTWSYRRVKAGAYK
jgi:hypothetical protein